MQDKDEILEVIQKYSEAIMARDKGRIMDFIMKDGYPSIIGSGKHEMFQGWNEVELGLSTMLSDRKGKIVDRITKVQDLQIHNDVAWCFGEVYNTVDLEGSPSIEMTLRFTTVLKKGSDGWKIVHRHASTPQTGVSQGSTWPSTDGILSEINRWIADFDLNPHFKKQVNRTAVLNYLIKAKEMIEEG